MLTKKDFIAIEEIVDRKLEEKFEEKLAFLPTKDEFYTVMDKVMGELQAIRESNEMLNSRMGDHEDRICKLEDIHPQNSHQIAVV